MKKLMMIALMIVSLGVTTVAAQGIPKLGYINSVELVELMPETRAAQDQMAAKQTEFEGQLKAMYTEYENKLTDIQRRLPEMSDDMKAVEEKSLMDMQNRIATKEQRLQQTLGQLQVDLLTPIQEKAQTAINDVAKENGYTMIFDVSAGSLVYADDADNIIGLVRSKLGI